MTTERIYQDQLLGLDINGGPCEVCFSHMHAHKWVDLDEHGIVVSCDNSERGATEVFVFVEKEA
jgi:hypothetical protein